jgi:hypothetical protein
VVWCLFCVVWCMWGGVKCGLLCEVWCGELGDVV